MSKTNWKSVVETQSSKQFVLPDGWDSKATIAEKLGCSEDRVRIQLQPAIKIGAVEMKTFPVWDKDQKRVVRITAYRETPPKKS